MVLVRVLIIKKRIVVRCLDHGFAHLGVAGPAHRLRETDRLGLLASGGPIVTVAPQRDDPLVRLRAVQENVEPALEPAARGQRTRRVDVGSLIEQHRHEAIDIV